MYKNPQPIYCAISTPWLVVLYCVVSFDLRISSITSSGYSKDLKNVRTFSPEATRLYQPSCRKKQMITIYKISILTIKLLVFWWTGSGAPGPPGAERQMQTVSRRTEQWRQAYCRPKHWLFPSHLVPDWLRSREKSSLILGNSRALRQKCPQG